MCITPLGSGQEVGRSCHMIEFRNMKILCDIGIHPGYSGLNGLPFLDTVVDLSKIDVLLVTHFHLDHVASLPYLTEHTNFNGLIYMTHPTKAVTRLLLGDYIRLLQLQQKQQQQQNGSTTADGSTSNDNNNIGMLYTEADLNNCLNKVICIDYHTTIQYAKGDCHFYALNAGHVLGACMYHITIGDRTILYTGDYSMEEDRHLMAAEIPFRQENHPHPNPSSQNSGTTTTMTANTTTDVLICESTYGVQVHASRTERETRFTTTIERIVSRGGKCLIPVFALGRAQELLLILDEYWQQHSHLQNVPIWYASKLASRALRVYQTYSNMMNLHIRDQMDVGNPFQFQFIHNLKSVQHLNDDNNTPCVVFASPGMLQSGVSRQLFDRWASDPKNGVIIAGYAVDHTLAKEIMLQPKEVMTLEGRKQPLNCLVDYVSFSAHVDFVQNRNFIHQVAPKHIVLVHGSKEEMGRLKGALMLQYKQYPEVRYYDIRVCVLVCVHVWRASIVSRLRVGQFVYIDYTAVECENIFL
jgi:cleavage and polyadenylation specificity factor subunit 3